MPSKSPLLTPHVLAKTKRLGEWIRTQRKPLKLSASVVAEAAGMSRVTLHRIEKGEPWGLISCKWLRVSQRDFYILI
jgi:DNA-binding XRE family transcriptional regulator